MDAKEEQRAAIKFCYKAGFSASESVELFKKAYGDGSASRTTIFEWFKRFRDGRESLKDEERSGRPTSSRNADNIAAVEEMIKEDRKTTSRMIAATLDIPKTVVLRILTEDLKKRKLCARFVPHDLREDQMDNRVTACQDLLNMIEDDEHFLDKIITGDETWCFAYDPETKRQSSEWVGEHSPPPRKLRFQKSRVKTMLIVFFDSKGVVHKEFLEEGCTINAQYYRAVLERLISRIRRVRPALFGDRDFFLLHDNAPAHTAASVRQFLAQKQVATLNHPPYSPDLAPADYFLFPKLKLHLKGTKFNTIADIQKAVTDELRAIPSEFFSKAMKKLKSRAALCIQSNGSYFE